MLINTQETKISRQFKDSKALIEHSNFMDDIFTNIEKHNPGQKIKLLIVLDDIITDSLRSKRFNPIVT